MGITRVDNVDAAVALAESLKASGQYDWFRGQVQNWPVQPSFTRLSPEARERALEKLGRFEGWVKHTPGLEHLAAHPDSIIAVAQHYGLPTTFVDFTTDPRVAGFFATHGGQQSGMACILLLDTADLLDFWTSWAPEYRAPECLAFPVKDLWRLEAQRGCFLFCPYGNIEEMYDFDRILFPHADPYAGIDPREVYPVRKSHLEILLDQFFMNEMLKENLRHVDFSLWSTVRFDRPGGFDAEVFPGGIPEHPSWSRERLLPWLEAPGEAFPGVAAGSRVTIALDASRPLAEIQRGVRHQVERVMEANAAARRTLVGWELDVAGGGGLHPRFARRLADCFARLWDGLRGLPCPDADLVAALGTCAAFAVAMRGDLGNPDLVPWEEAARRCLDDARWLEFGAGDGSYSRGYASARSLGGAVRPDLAAFAAEEWRDHLAGDIHFVLHTARDPRLVYDFDRLAHVFCVEVAPLQVANGREAVFFSPARLDALGLP